MRFIISAVLIIIFCYFRLQSTLFVYLHGRIIEDQGPNAINTVNGYGAYQYNDILNPFSEDFIVLSKVRAKNTDPTEYSYYIVSKIDSFLKIGTKAEKITAVGASKGAVIAMLTSTHLKNRNVNSSSWPVATIPI